MSDCENCNGTGWVCEDHPNTPWGDGDDCCGGAGMPCETCNHSDGRHDPPRMPPGTQVVWTAKDGWAN